MIEEKERLLAGEATTCRLVRQSVDLADPAARGAFLDRALAGATRALIITEGLLTYLDAGVVAALAHDLARPEVEGWVFDILSPATRAMVMKAMRADLANAPMRFAPPDGVGYFEALGWQAVDIVSVFVEAAGSGACRGSCVSWRACRCRNPIRGDWAGRNGREWRAANAGRAPSHLSV